MGRVATGAAGAVLLVLAACSHAEDARPALAEHARLAEPVDGTPPETYTLGDETRPVLGGPTERTLRVPVAAGTGRTFTFPLPPALRPPADGALIATGVYQRGKRVHALTAQRLAVGGGTATIALPAGARGPGPAPVLTLALTRPPTAPVVETQSRAVPIPADATLHLAYALSEAAAAPETGPVTLEIEARHGDTVSPVWTTTVWPRTPGTHRWREVSVPLTALAGLDATFTFRARPGGAMPTMLVPLWGDPTIVAPAARPPERRNVILISLDTLRADRVGVYGSYRPTTPALDALAAEAAVLTNAWAPWPETSGSHMSLFTSRYPSEHGVTGFIHAPAATIELMAERLRREGYLTRAFTENGGVWANAGFARGFSAYGERRSPDFVYRGEAAGTFDDAITWLEAHAARTFFLFVHTYEVHAPYAPPTAYRALFADSPPREPGRFGLEALAYDRETRHTDDQVGRLIAAVRRLELARRSIVIVTSDHGEEFGEHGGRGHGRSLHREVLHVPLIVWAPGLVPPARLATPASLLDIAPTVHDLLGLAADPTHRGRSLAASLRTGTAANGPGNDRVLVAEVDRVDRKIPYRRIAARRGGATAILDLTDDALRCYGSDDPGETRPVDQCPELAAAIAAHRASVTRGAREPATDDLDPRLVEKMRALGYLE